MTTNIGSLETIRTKLLALSPARNPLLNFKHGRGLLLRITDELPNQVYDLLISHKTLKFDPVPYPSESQLREAGYFEYDEESEEWLRIKEAPTPAVWAMELGIDANFELPSSHEAPAGVTPSIIDSSTQIDSPHSENAQHTMVELDDGEGPVEEEATESGENLNLPEKHSDAYIQTLLYPDRLESTLRNIRRRSKSAIEESGVNILYLAFGFLRWYESQDSDVERTAPLFLMPISIEKSVLDPQTRTFKYSISFSGDDILPNLSLFELLKKDFGLALPDLDNTTNPESYLKDVEKMIKHAQPRWEVKRFGTISFFNFSKLLMWRDLDPANWPGGDSSLSGHPIIKRFLQSSDENAGSGPGEDDYQIDEISDIHEKYPIIDDADSSQHSAIKDVIDGKNLIIEGPPGTGKSQTITNIIAAALANKKKVLFVADKLVALEVVKRRLDNAGLGDFCLELHSHKTQKRMVLDDIKSRMDKIGSYRSPEGIQVEIDRYEDLKKNLNDYALEINSIWKETGESIHQILCASTRYCDIIDVNPEDIESEGINGNTFTKSYQRKVLDDLNTYKSTYKKVSDQLISSQEIEAHPWYGVYIERVTPLQSTEIAKSLSQWQINCLNLVKQIDRATAIINQSTLEIDDLITAKALVDDITKLKNYPHDSNFQFLPLLKDSLLNDFGDFIDLNKSIQRRTAEYSKYLQNPILSDHSTTEDLTAITKLLVEYQIPGTTSFSTIRAFHDSISSVCSIIGSVMDQFANILDFIGEDYRAFFPSNLDGLHEVNNLVSIASKLDNHLWSKRDGLFDDEDLDPIILEFMEDVKVLIPLSQKLDRNYNLANLPSAAEFRSIQAIYRDTSPFRIFKAPWRESRRQLRKIALNPNIKLQELVSSINDLGDYSERIEKFNASEYSTVFGDYYKGLDTNIDLISTLRDWYGDVRSTFGRGLGSRAVLGDLLITMPIKASQELRELLKGGLLSRIEEVLSWWNSNKELLSQISTDAPLVGENTSLVKFQKKLNVALEGYKKVLSRNDLSADEVIELKQDVENLLLDFASLKTNQVPKVLGFDSDIMIPKNSKTNSDELTVFENTLALANIVQNELIIPELRSSIESNATPTYLDSLVEIGNELSSALDDHNTTFDIFQQKADLKPEAWFIKPGTSLRNLLERNANAIENEDWLETWLQFVRLRFSIVKNGFAKLFKTVDDRLLPIDNITDAFLAAAYHRISLEILNESPHLCEYPGHLREDLQSQFAQYDVTIKNLQRLYIASKAGNVSIPYGNSGGLKRDYTELALLKNECAKKTGFLPIRQLVNRSGKALIAMKPCFMMGPMSVAQFLKPGKLKFDIAIMDEASQIRPEEALGIIARADQLVVVGDPKQLPPTRFFDRIIEEEDDDETMAIEESESILDAVAPLLPMRQLAWHYRSQHESLIKFSNYFFYDGNLVVFPSPHGESDEYGVKYKRVKQGAFENGVNIEEARVVVHAVKEHLLAHRNESLGVVTMNAKQRDRIEIEIEEQSKHDSEFRLALEYNQSELRDPLFIKNLENVQGDERDVIFISTTYGPTKAGGRVMQRFGPINSAVGWRRLNVLFTRSKKRMHLFTSMSSSDILVSGTSSRGVIALRDFLVYAKTGKINIVKITDRPPANDFEVAVAKRLQSEGYECVYQLGVAGYYMDIAVKDPNRPGEYVVGIECDGATYHSAKSARDRDRLRQEVLEGLGWEIRRIWSTDWFQNPTAALTPILKRLGKLTYNPKKELRQKLMDYHQAVILKALPNLDEANSILAPEMLDAIMRLLPTTHEDFLQIPLRLRENLTIEEAGYIEPILNMIAAADLK